MSGLDPRATFVFDTRELGRRPGSQQTLSPTLVAPTELGIEIISVPEGSPIDLDLRMEAVMEGVLLTGSAEVDMAGECARCLEPIEDTLVVRFQELFVYEDSRSSVAAGDDLDDELDVRRLDGDLIDLEPLLRDAVVLALPFQPLCSPDCAGLCPECGVRLDDDREHRHAEPIDPRWSALSDLTGDN